MHMCGEPLRDKAYDVLCDGLVWVYILIYGLVRFFNLVFIGLIFHTCSLTVVLVRNSVSEIRSVIFMCLNPLSSSSEKHQKVSNLFEIRETLIRVMSV